MPGLYDPTEAPEPDLWYPASPAAQLLVACLQACKDILRLGAVLDQRRPSADRRGMTLLSTPILSIVDNTVALHKLLGQEDRSSWPPEDQVVFQHVGKKLRKLAHGSLRKLRSTRSAHHDVDCLGPDSAPRATPEVVLEPLGHVLILLTLALNHERVFTWTRIPDETKPEEIELFIEAAARFRTVTDDEGYRRPREILRLTITKDPRLEAFESIDATITLYNHLVQDAGYPRQQIVTRPQAPVPSAEPSQT